MYSFSLISMTDPPTSLFERWTAIMMSLTGQVCTPAAVRLEHTGLLDEPPMDANLGDSVDRG